MNLYENKFNILVEIGAVSQFFNDVYRVFHDRIIE